MASQITPVGSMPILSVGTSAKAVSSKPGPSPARSAGGPAPLPGNPDIAVAQVNQHLEQAQTELKLQVDAGSGRTVFQVVQQGTGEVVLQVPSEEVLGMSRRVRDLEGQTGGLLDKEG